ncbi:MAG: DNA mismatch repair endonuclease MutL [Elusimicrobiota bacterium]|jgi:DNA mismatch repair protein MutL|nr:DNA mismatch repair endonuclease MutL [Elusimicrobiota bacterium]
MPINILSPETINKIAAGEVVERPLNVVKELVENSLDACASTINIEIENAGKKLIRISDNGIGMTKDDLELSIMRHATSKISDFNDLPYVQSLGFRGEALSSIAAVSKFEITTKKRGEENAWKLETQGGHNTKISPASSAEGLICEVRDLFFNTPVREKFLKSEATEKTRIINAVEEIALVNNDVSFKFSSDNKTIFLVKKTDNKTERFGDILGKDFSSKLRNLKIEAQKVSLDIFYTDREHCQNTRKYQYLFVNSRPLNLPKWLIACVNNAYKESIPRDKFPGFIIYIYIDPSEIDVNIHPAKREIKFSNENMLYDFIFRNLKEAVVSHSHPQINVFDSPIQKIIDQNQNKDNSNFQNYSSPETVISKSKPSFDIDINETQTRYNALPKYSPLNNYAKVNVKQENFGTEFDDDIKAIGQAFCAYIIVEKEDELYIVDQHAAAERVRYEMYIDQTDNKKLIIQQMLIPETFTLIPSLSSLLKSNLEVLQSLGIQIEEFGDSSFRISSYPAIFGDASIEQIVRAVLDNLENDKNIEIEKKREKIIRAACRASVKAGDFISPLESKKLMRDLFKCKNPFTCPHGRPTAYSISKNELEKFFKRK